MVNAICSTAFLLEDIEEQAINKTIRVVFDSQITEFTLDMKMLVEDMNSRIVEHPKEALEKIMKATATAIPSATQTQGLSHLALATSYASALIKPPPNINPKIAAREGIRARQFLLTGIKDSAYGQYNSQQLKKQLNKIARDLGLNEGKIRSAVIQKEGRTLIEVDSDEAAKWFANPVNMAEICSMIGEDVTLKTRSFNILAFNAPLNLDTPDKTQGRDKRSQWPRRGHHHSNQMGISPKQKVTKSKVSPPYCLI